MKDVDYLMESAGETVAYMQNYVEQKVELIKLEAAEKTATTVSSLLTSFVILLLVGIAGLMGTITIALFLGMWFNNYALAFLTVTVFYILLAVLAYTFRETVITNPVVSVVITKMFK